MEVIPSAAYVSLSVSIEEAGGVAKARELALELAGTLEFTGPELDRVARVVTEAATNIVQHAGKGEILLRPFALQAPVGLEVLALDQGPGIANVAVASRDGFSTSGGAGLGLSAIARLSTCFEISSLPGKGTALLARVGGGTSKPLAQSLLQWGVVCVPKREEKECGDAWAVTAAPGRNTVLIVDGLGHGSSAFAAAGQALRVFREVHGARLEEKLRALHEGLRETRGAVAALARVDWERREVRYAGAGNIAGTLVPASGRLANLVSHNGTLGDGVPRVQEFTYPWPDRGLLVLHSDGLSSHWDLEPYPGLTRKDPSLIAGVLYRDFASRRDDVVVFVGREREEITTGQAGGSR